MFAAIVSAITAALSGLSRMAGSIGIYFAGKTAANLKHEKAARKEDQKDAERWKNRPRTRSALLERMRKRRYRRRSRRK